MNTAQYLARKLSNEGVRYVFGIPGGPSIPYMEAFRDEGIEFILVSNEAAAGFMADVTARLTGTPGICHATFGPGATNLSTGAGSGLLDRSPMLILTTEIGDKMRHRTVQMNIDHQQLFAPLTKASFRVAGNNLPAILNNSISICRDEYPGPVHIGFPENVADIQVSDFSEPAEIERKIPANTSSEAISELLRSSRFPVIAAGLTAKRLGLNSGLSNFLTRTRIPLVVTPMAKGIVDENNGSYAGVLFHARSENLEKLFSMADLVIGFGYDPVEFNYESWMPSVPLIHFGTICADLPDNKNVYQYTGPPGEWFALLEEIDVEQLKDSAAIVKGIRNEMSEAFHGFRKHFGPVSALGVLQEELPAGSVITADVGSHLHLAGQFLDLHCNHELLMTNGWSSMGFGVPAALAAALNRPEQRAVCITGDGGFLMMCGELITARRYKLPVIIVVLSDGELNLIKVKQSWKSLSPYATLLYQGELFGSDIFLGVKVLNASTEGSMRSALKQALAMQEPVIINAVIDPADYQLLITRR
jgi:acetolactate synthase-1/2/3 large subunit